MFDRFTDRARRVMGLARQEANTLESSYIGSEHVFLGLIGEGGGVAASVLEGVGFCGDPTLDMVRVLAAKKAIPGAVTEGQLPFTPRAKKLLELASATAHDLGHNYIGTEHLLLGALGDAGGFARQALRDADPLNSVTVEQVRDSVLRRLGQKPAPRPALTATDYTALAIRTESPPAGAAKRFQDQRYVRLLHAGLGMATEVGEFLDPIKKWAFYGKEIDGVNLQEEIGDLCWYLAIGIDSINEILPADQRKNFGEILAQNIQKLQARFPDRFTEEHALNRDLDEERKILEG